MALYSNIAGFNNSIDPSLLTAAVDDGGGSYTNSEGYTIQDASGNVIQPVGVPAGLQTNIQTDTGGTATVIPAPPTLPVTLPKTVTDYWMALSALALVYTAVTGKGILFKRDIGIVVGLGSLYLSLRKKQLHG